MNKHLFGLSVAGLISGLCSSLTLLIFEKTGGDNIGGLMVSGLIFGLAIASYTISTKLGSSRGRILRAILFIIASGLICFGATLITGSMLFGNAFAGSHTPMPISPAFSGGMIGSMGLVIAFALLIHPLPLFSIAIILWGMLLSMSMYIPGLYDIEFLYLPLIWQTGVAFALGLAVDYQAKRLT